MTKTKAIPAAAIQSVLMEAYRAENDQGQVFMFYHWHTPSSDRIRVTIDGDYLQTLGWDKRRISFFDAVQILANANAIDHLAQMPVHLLEVPIP